MMKLKINLMLLLASTFIISCADGVVDKPADLENVEQNTEFDWVVDEFADIKVLRYQIPGWEDLSLKEQKLVYYLVQAGLSGKTQLLRRSLPDIRDSVNKFLSLNKHNIIKIQCFPFIMYLKKDNAYRIDAGHDSGNFFFEISPLTRRDR